MMFSNKIILVIAILFSLSSFTQAELPEPLLNVDFSTYLGGKAGVENLRQSITNPIDGKVYVTGGSFSAYYPTTVGAYDRTPAATGREKATLTALSIDGSQISSSTYFGAPSTSTSTQFARGYNILIEDPNNIYILGRSGPNAPTTPGVIQETFHTNKAQAGNYGSTNAFVAKFSSDLSRLEAMTYLAPLPGTAVTDYSFIVRSAAVVPSVGLAVLMGRGGGNWAPNVQSAFANSLFPKGLGENAYAEILILSFDLSSVLCAREIGGTMQGGVVYNETTGLINYANLVKPNMAPYLNVPPGAFRSTHSGSQYDIHVGSIDPTNCNEVSATYLPNGHIEKDPIVPVLRDGGVVVAWNAVDASWGDSFPGYDKTYNGNGTTAGTGLQSNYSGDIILAKLDSNLYPQAVTYVGGKFGDGPEGIARINNSVCVSGATYSDNFPVTANAYQPGLKGTAGGSTETDALLFCMTDDLSSLVYGTYLGGSKKDFARNVSVDQVTGAIVVIGNTKSVDFPTTGSSSPAPAQAKKSSTTNDTDGFVVKFHSYFIP